MDRGGDYTGMCDKVLSNVFSRPSVDLEELTDSR